MGRYALITLFILALISPAYAMDPLSLKDLADTVEARFPVYDSYVAGTGAPYTYVDAHIFNGSGTVHGMTTADIALKSLSLSQFSSTNLTQILTRNHSDLQNILGGGGYHLSLTDYNSLTTSGVLLSYATKAYVNGTDEILSARDLNIESNLYNHIGATSAHGIVTSEVVFTSKSNTFGAFNQQMTNALTVGSASDLASSTYALYANGKSYIADLLYLGAGKTVMPASNSTYTGIGDANLTTSPGLFIFGPSYSTASSRGHVNIYALTGDSDAASGAITFNGYNAGTTAWGEFKKTGAFYLYTLGSAGTGTDLVIDSGKQIIPKSSSKRYKFNIKPLDIKPSNFMKLQPVSFNYKVNLSKSWSLCAEDVYKIFPDAVTLIKGKAESIKSECITAVLVFMVQYQQKRIDNLEKRIELLEMRR